MSAHLTVGQRAMLEADLRQRQSVLGRRLAEHHGGLTRVEHAQQLLEQEADNAPERESELGLDLALTDIEARELAAIKQALARLAADGYGQCAGCEGAIPFDRLRAEPWALRCVGCEAAREAAAGR